MTKTDMEEWLAADEQLRHSSRADAGPSTAGFKNGLALPLSIHAIDPLADPRWESFIERHPRTSIFHTPAWLRALRRTYGYTPVAYTTTPQGVDLQNGILFCEVNSWLTGKRLVSLPFSDHCEPLMDQSVEFQQVYTDLERLVSSGHWRYIELRPIKTLQLSPSVFHSTLQYHFHQLDLTPELHVIFQNFHKSSIQRKIHRAEREGLVYREGSDVELLAAFYKLFSVTRQRHKVPPQPVSWFRNLIGSFGDGLKVRLALKGDLPVASMITIRHKDTVVYKYGCSDARYNHLGGIHLLYWRAIQEAKEIGARVFDFGRCDIGQEGLRAFKRRWGASESTLTYSRYAIADNSAMHFPPEEGSLKMRFAREVFAHMPVRCLSLLGEILYKHVG
jgi:Acetyltransferase (GNAT) domain